MISERNRSSAETANLKAELSVLDERLAAAQLDDAKRAHEAKIAHVSLILDRRLTLMRTMDEALEKAGEAARDIKRIDKEELAADIAGIDQRFPIQRGEFQIVAAIRLASLGLGTDKRMDKSVPAMSVTDFSKRQHRQIVGELQDKTPTAAPAPSEAAPVIAKPDTTAPRIVATVPPKPSPHTRANADRSKPNPRRIEVSVPTE